MTLLWLAVLPLAGAAPWEDATSSTIGQTGQWSNKVELADVDNDGDVDILFANGGAYSSAGTPELNRLFLNDGGGVFMEATQLVMGGIADLTRSLKVRDVDGDGLDDVFMAGAWQSRSRLLMADGLGGFDEVSRTHLPAVELSCGDLELGDVDGDGDLDAVLADSGPGNALLGTGELTRLWLNDGTGVFTDVTVTHMPQVPVGWSWELELVDVDNDLDLDLAISCKTCAGSLLFDNDGTGVFTDVSQARLPPGSNNYEFEALDLSGDGYLDLVTINDGPGLRERILLNDGTGAFTDATATLAPGPTNPGEDDNVVVLLDFDDDADVDVLIGSLSGSDRVWVNDGAGSMSLVEDVLAGPFTPGTLGLAAADLDDDGRLDVVMSQGELAEDDRVFLGVDVPVDTQPPAVPLVQTFVDPVTLPVWLRARVHDRLTPVMAHQFAEVTLAWSADDGASGSVPLMPAGGTLWQAQLVDPAPGTTVTYEVCASDVAGNATCGTSETLVVEGSAATDPPTTTDPTTDSTPTGDNPTTGTPADDEGGAAELDGSGGCGCAGAGGAVPSPWVVVLGLLGARRWRR